MVEFILGKEKYPLEELAEILEDINGESQEKGESTSVYPGMKIEGDLKERVGLWFSLCGVVLSLCRVLCRNMIGAKSFFNSFKSFQIFSKISKKN